MANQSILIMVNGEEDFLLYERILSQEGFNILRAGRSNSNFQIALEREPDLVLMDQWQFDTDGHEVLKRLKERHVPTRVMICPVAYDSIPFLTRLIRAGVCDYLRIPVDARQLVNAVRGALARESTLMGDPAPIVEKFLTQVENLECDLDRTEYSTGN